MAPFSGNKTRQVRHYVKYAVAILATVSLIVAGIQGRLSAIDVALYVSFIYILGTFTHPIRTNV